MALLAGWSCRWVCSIGEETPVADAMPGRLKGTRERDDRDWCMLATGGSRTIGDMGLVMINCP